MKWWVPHPWTCLLLGDAVGCMCGGTPVWGRKLSYLISHLPSDWGSRRPGSILCPVRQQLNDAGLVTYTLRASVKWGYTPCPLFLRASLQSSHEKTPGERRWKSWNHSPLAGFYSDSSLCGCLRQLPTSEPCFLQPRSVDVSSSGKFCSGVYTRGFEAIYQTPLPGTALRCWQQVAGSLQMCCLFQQRNIRGGRGEGSLLFLPNHTY